MNAKNEDRSVGTQGGGPATARRRFLAGAGLVAGSTAAGVLLGGSLADSASAAESTSYAPIPRSALGPALTFGPTAHPYYVGRIRDDLYWVTDGGYQAMFLTTRKGVVLVDAPPSIGVNLQRAINRVTEASGRPNKVTHLIYSHSHADHIGAASLFKHDVVRIGHVETRNLLLRANDPNRPAPTATFTHHHTVEVGGQRLVLNYHGPSHTPDTIFISAPEQRALMVVDIAFPGWVPFKSLAVAQDVPGMIKAQDLILDYQWDTLVGGHVGRLGTRNDVKLQIDYVKDLVAQARHTVEHLDPTPYLQRYGINSWAGFNAYHDAASAAIAAPVTKKYLGKLAAVDVYTIDNAFAAFEFAVRVDGGQLGPFGINRI